MNGRNFRYFINIKLNETHHSVAGHFGKLYESRCMISVQYQGTSLFSITIGKSD